MAAHSTGRYDSFQDGRTSKLTPTLCNLRRGRKYFNNRAQRRTLKSYLTGIVVEKLPDLLFRGPVSGTEAQLSGGRP